ncbi:transcription termination factor 5, mitochondrial [Frieseomelitta varia]|uniref:transcription termination factor 5, mitochondrial n=1 Tax=Frieseomelitta varia TaxID=561572 RepID=UPI001CB69664|nr:transcription termination factor 5, mitochondrial [Frieseomelitta varia]
MFKQTFKTNFIIKQFGKLISPITTESKICNILATNLKLDGNAIKILHENKVDSKLRKIPEEQIIRNCVILQNMNVRLDKVELLIPCLKLQPKTLRNRILIFKEMGVKSINLYNIRRFLLLMQKSTSYFKKLFDIPRNKSIMKIIFSNVDLTYNEIDKYIIKNETHTTIGYYYQFCIMYYQKHHMKLDNKLFHKRKKFKYVSLTEMTRLLDILKNKCQLDEKFLEKHLYVLNIDVNNVEEVLNELNTNLNEKSVIDLIKLYPRILLHDISKIKNTFQLYQNFDLQNQSHRSILQGFKINKDTFIERYTDFANNLELDVWLKHPRLVFMLYYHKSITNRLTYMKHLNCSNNANTHTYLSNKDFFLRYIEGDLSHTAATKHVSYILKKEFGDNKIHLLSSIKKHPFWKSIPLLRIDKTIKYLKKYFSIEDICKNIQIILYPRSLIHDTLNLSYKEYSPQNGYNFTSTQYLALCLYKLEQKYHFSGNGVWEVEISVFKSNLFEDVYELDNLIERMNVDENEVMNLSGEAWFEHLLQ